MKFTNEQEVQIAEVLEWLQRAGSITWTENTPEEQKATGAAAKGTIKLHLMPDDEEVAIIGIDDDNSNFATEGYTGIGVCATADVFKNILSNKR